MASALQWFCGSLREEGIELTRELATGCHSSLRCLYFFFCGDEISP